VLASGLIGAQALAGAIRKLPLPGFLSFLTERGGIGSYVLGLGSAGLLSAGVGMIMPRFAPSVLAGGVVGEVARIVRDVLLHKLGLTGMGVYLTPGNAAGAMPLGWMGDYLTPGNAAGALPLGDYGMSGDDTVSEELAVFG